MIVAYLRVSTGKQLLENQKNEISAFAQNRNMVIDQWVTEIASGCKQRNDRKLGTLLRRMKKGDSLIVTELSRLSRTLIDIMTIMGTLLQKGVVLYSTKERYSFDNSLNSKVLCFAFGLVAEIERNLISMRTREALALRREQGVKLGRKKKAVIPNRKYCWTTGMKLFEQSTPDRVSLLFAVSITFREKHSIGFGAIICH